MLQDIDRTVSFVRRGMTWADACVLVLAQENETGFLLSDDLAVRTRALSAGLGVFGTVGILIDGKRDGYLSSLKEVLDRLIQFGFYLDPNGSLYREALRLAGES